MRDALVLVNEATDPITGGVQSVNQSVSLISATQRVGDSLMASLNQLGDTQRRVEAEIILRSIGGFTGASRRDEPTMFCTSLLSNTD